MRILVYSLVACSCVQVQACKRSPSAIIASELPGLYVCNLPGAVQSVDLRVDGEFVQAIGTGPEGKIHRGHWGFETSEVGPHVMLLPYHFQWPSYLVPPRTGAWVAEAKRDRDGSMLLVISEDDGLYCVRRATSSTD
jgi:hypothetical protein